MWACADVTSTQTISHLTVRTIHRLSSSVFVPSQTNEQNSSWRLSFFRTVRRQNNIYLSANYCIFSKFYCLYLSFLVRLHVYGLSLHVKSCLESSIKITICTIAVIFKCRQCPLGFCFFLITKTRLFKYIENFTTKNWKFSGKNSDIFHISAQNIDCGYSLEPPRRGGSNECPQSMFLSGNKKNNVYPYEPKFYYIKVGV